MFTPKGKYPSKRRASQVMSSAKANRKKLRCAHLAEPAVATTAKEVAKERLAQLTDSKKDAEKKVRAGETEANLCDVELATLGDELEGLKSLLTSKEEEIMEKVLTREEIDAKVEEDKADFLRFSILAKAAAKEVQVEESREHGMAPAATTDVKIENFTGQGGKSLAQIKDELLLHKGSDLLDKIRFPEVQHLAAFLRRLQEGFLYLHPEVVTLWMGKSDAWKEIHGATPLIKTQHANEAIYITRIITYLQLENDLA